MLFETMIRALITPQSKCNYGVDHMTCYGNDFLICGPTGTWTFMPCGEGTSCNDSGASIFCDYKSQTNMDQVGISSNNEDVECDSSRINMECVEDNFRTCDHGKWVNMNCPTGTSCRTDPIAILVCDTLSSSPIGVTVDSVGISSLDIDMDDEEQPTATKSTDEEQSTALESGFCSEDGKYQCVGVNYATMMNDTITCG